MPACSASGKRVRLRQVRPRDGEPLNFAHGRLLEHRLAVLWGCPLDRPVTPFGLSRIQFAGLYEFAVSLSRLSSFETGPVGFEPTTSPLGSQGALQSKKAGCCWQLVFARHIFPRKTQMFVQSSRKWGLHGGHPFGGEFCPSIWESPFQVGPCTFPKEHQTKSCNFERVLYVVIALPL